MAETGEGAFQQMWADHQAKEQKGPKDRDLWGLQPVTADSWYLSLASKFIVISFRLHCFSIAAYIPENLMDE